MYMYECILMCVFVAGCVCSIGYGGSQREWIVLWTDGEAHLVVTVYSVIFYAAPCFVYVCVCARVCVFSLVYIPPTWKGIPR